jgi:hypothetical protein
MSANMKLGFGLNAGGSTASSVATGEVSTFVVEGISSYNMIGSGVVKLGNSDSDFTVSTMDMKAGNTVGVVLVTNFFYVSPLSYGSTYRIQGVITLTPSASANLFYFTLLAAGFISTETNIITYTSVGTTAVDIPFDTTVKSANVYAITNSFKMTTLFTADAAVMYKSVTITLTNG